MFKKGQKAYAIVNIKCPRCHEADMFETGSFSFNKPFEMKERCDKCGEDFFPEPGYYYGAMFLSYIFTGFFCIFFVLFFHWVLGWSTNASFALLIAVMGIGFVYVFRLARALFLGMHVKYDPHAIERYQQQGGAMNNKSTASQFGGR